MKKVLILLSLIMFCATTVYATDFAPTLLKLSADPVIQYSFDGSELKIPVQVSGTSAGLILCVFTRDKANEIPETQNGFLGWHYVNKVDTCLYYSALQGFGIGSNTVVWEGKDQDGGVIPAGDYTYYMWAYDNMGTKTKMSDFTTWSTRAYKFQEVNENGLPMANPFFYRHHQRWVVGGDPSDSTLLQSTTVTHVSGWGGANKPQVDPYDFNYFYVAVNNAEAKNGSICKFKWVPGGAAELQTGWGEDGFATIYSREGGNCPGAFSDGTYLYGATDSSGNEPEVNFYIYDMDGGLVDEIDLTEWWSHPDEFAAGGQMNGGMNAVSLRHNKLFLNSHRSCIVQMVDPLRYLESDEWSDFFVWTNENGDYVLDHNFEDTAALPWVCFDYNVGPYTYSMSSDDNQFSGVNAYDVGAVSFGLLAPDGTGLGYFAFSGETAGWKKGIKYIDSDTPFDGIYCDNMHTGGSHYDWDVEKAETGLYFIGHDSISGLITSGVGVAEAAPAAFSVAQNSPNPFNPATTISFSLAEAGNVAVEVFNVAGQKVDTLVDGFMSAGSHSMVWDASDFSAGVYFYTVKSGGFSKTMKMTLVK